MVDVNKMEGNSACLRSRREKVTFSVCGLTLDIGRQRMTEADFNSLLEIAREKGVLGAMPP